MNKHKCPRCLKQVDAETRHSCIKRVDLTRSIAPQYGVNFAGHPNWRRMVSDAEYRKSELELDVIGI